MYVEYATILILVAPEAYPEIRVKVKVVYYQRIKKYQKRMVKWVREEKVAKKLCIIKPAITVGSWN